MRYISEICSQVEGVVPQYRYFMGVDDPNYSAVLTDLDTGESSSVDGKLIPYFNDVLGFSDHALPSEWVAIMNTSKTAMLHKYVRSCLTTYMSNVAEFSDVDISILYAGGLSDNTGVSGGRRNLVIDTINESIKVSGKLGSVCVREAHFSGVSSVHTLYEFLGMMCRETHLNMMSYETIQFYHRTQGYRTYVSLVHNQEADRFFTKMYFDVCGAKP